MFRKEFVTDTDPLVGLGDSWRDRNDLRLEREAVETGSEKEKAD